MLTRARAADLLDTKRLHAESEDVGEYLDKIEASLLEEDHGFPARNEFEWDVDDFDLTEAGSLRDREPRATEARDELDELEKMLALLGNSYAVAETDDEDVAEVDFEKEFGFPKVDLDFAEPTENAAPIESDVAEPTETAAPIESVSASTVVDKNETYKNALNRMKSSTIDKWRAGDAFDVVVADPVKIRPNAKYSCFGLNPLGTPIDYTYYDMKTPLYVDKTKKPVRVVANLEYAADPELYRCAAERKSTLRISEGTYLGCETWETTESDKISGLAIMCVRMFLRFKVPDTKNTFIDAFYSPWYMPRSKKGETLKNRAFELALIGTLKTACEAEGAEFDDVEGLRRMLKTSIGKIDAERFALHLDSSGV